MSTANEFVQRLTTDTKLQEKVQIATAGITDAGAQIEALVGVATEAGYDVTAQDLVDACQAMGPQGELNDQALDAVAGGINLQSPVAAAAIRLGLQTNITVLRIR